MKINNKNLLNKKKKKKNFLFNYKNNKILFIFLIFLSNLPFQNADDVNNVTENFVEKIKDEDIDFWFKFSRYKFIHGFAASLSIIIVSELGDKTFFIAAILAMKQNRWTVFLGAISALVLMTFLSSVMGLAANVIPKSYINFVSIILFVIFGIKMIYDGLTMTEDESNEEFEEVQKILSKKESMDSDHSLLISNDDLESGVTKNVKSINFPTRIKRKFMHFFSLVFIETFVMTFLAEWGDRSQISTVILSAREDVISVTLGACIGHSLCTGLAVLGGRMIAKMISVKTVTLIGGFIFVGFGIFASILGLN